MYAVFYADKVTCNTNKVTPRKTRKLTFSLAAMKLSATLSATPVSFRKNSLLYLFCLIISSIRSLVHTSGEATLCKTAYHVVKSHSAGADLGGGCRRSAPLPPWDDLWLSNTTWCLRPVTSQLRHSLVVHPLLKITLVPSPLRYQGHLRFRVIRLHLFHYDNFMACSTVLI